MTQTQAISTLRNAYKYVLALRVDELEATIWARTLGTLHAAKEKVIAAQCSDQIHADTMALLSDFEAHKCR